MLLSKPNRIFISVGMSLLISNVPANVFAGGMISTASIVQELNRNQAQAKVDEFLQQNVVREELAKRGVSADEISSRLASLSTEEMRQLSKQMDEARAGGDILITILLVVLIIFLIKRI